MNIACLGWGSLIWKAGALPVKEDWHADGPRVPVEFCRIGDNGELATAICLNAAPVQVFWAPLAVANLAMACEALREREQIPAERSDGIGSLWISTAPVGPLSEWARSREIDALIWTGLPARSQSIEGRVPTLEEALHYLGTLTGEKAEHARDYLQRVPGQIDTPYRRAIIKGLHWQA